MLVYIDGGVARKCMGHADIIIKRLKDTSSVGRKQKTKRNTGGVIADENAEVRFLGFVDCLPSCSDHYLVSQSNNAFYLAWLKT